jgi:hypothetical protein
MMPLLSVCVAQSRFCAVEVHGLPVYVEHSSILRQNASAARERGDQQSTVDPEPHRRADDAVLVVGTARWARALRQVRRAAW